MSNSNLNKNSGDLNESWAALKEVLKRITRSLISIVRMPHFWRIVFNSRTSQAYYVILLIQFYADGCSESEAVEKVIRITRFVRVCRWVMAGLAGGIAGCGVWSYFMVFSG